MPEIQKVRWSHEALIDVMLTNPELTQGQLAAVFGYTEAWLSIIINSDAFQEKLAERRAEIINPMIQASFEDRLKAMVNKASEVVLDNLNTAPTPKVALQALEIGARALGYGAKVAGSQVQVNVMPVAVVPAKEVSGDTWMETYSPSRAPAAPQVTYDEANNPV